MTDRELIAEFTNRFYGKSFDTFAETLYEKANLIAFTVAHSYVDPNDDEADVDEDDANAVKVYDPEGMAYDIACLLNSLTGRKFSVSIDEK